MRILLVSVGSYGDLLPLMAIGAELRRRGRDVVLGAPASFADLAARVGVPFAALADSGRTDDSASNPNVWHPRRFVAAGAAGLYTRQIYGWIASRALPGDVVVAPAFALGARIAQETLGLALVTLQLVPFLMESRYAPPILPGLPLQAFLPPRVRHRISLRADQYVIGPAILPDLNQFRAELGLLPVHRLRYWWNSPGKLLLMFPPWYAPPQLDWPLQAVQLDFPSADRFGDSDHLDPELLSGLGGGEPPIAFTYGSFMRQGAAFFRTAVEICRRLDRRGLFVSPDAAQIPDRLPSSIRHVRYAPFGDLLPRCAALVHHGGIGTVAQALAAGIPQLVVPIFYNHFDDADRLVRLGVGASVPSRRFTAGRAVRRLRRLLSSPNVATACAAAQAKMASRDGIEAACDEIEAVAA